MKKKVLARSFIMGLICPLLIYLAAGTLDVIMQESNLVFYVMFAMGLLLFLLPVYFLMKEKKLNEKAASKLTAPAYLLGYAVTAVTLLYLVNDTIDMSKLFGHKFLGGIGLTIMLIILACGFGWAVLFRIGAAIVRSIKKR